MNDIYSGSVLKPRDIYLDIITFILYITLGLIHMVGDNIILPSIALYFGPILYQILHVSSADLLVPKSIVPSLVGKKSSETADRIIQ